MSKPCDFALSALNGDTIEFYEDDDICSGIVKSAEWMSSFKGGKVWTYTLESGKKVSNFSVVKVIKSSANLEKEEMLLHRVREQFRAQEPIDENIVNVETLIERSSLASSLKVAVLCVLKGDVRNLDIAEFLIRTRSREIRELQPGHLPTLTKASEGPEKEN